MSASPPSKSLLGRFASGLGRLKSAARLRAGRGDLIAALKKAEQRGDHKQTIEIASRLLDESGLSNADRLLSLTARAHARVNEKDYAGAIADAQVAHAIDPGNNSAWHNEGVAHYEQGHFEDACRCFDKAAEIETDTATQLWRVGAYVKCGKWGLATAATEEVLCEHPQHADALKWRAHLRRRFGDLKGAVADCTLALADTEVAGPKLTYLRSRAAVLIRLNKPRDAIKDFDHILALKPNDLKTIARRAELKAGVGALADAINDYDAILAVEPDNVDTMGRRARLKELVGDIDGAIADYRKIRHRGEHADNEIRLLTARNDNASVLDALAAAIEQRPQEVELRRRYNLERARMLLDTGEKEAAQELLNSAIEMLPQDAELRAMRAALLLDMERWWEAIADFDKVLRLQPNLVAGWSGRARAHAELGKPYLALGDARQALKLDHADPAAIDVLEQAHRQLAEAKAVFQRRGIPGQVCK